MGKNLSNHGRPNICLRPIRGGETPPSNWFQVDFDETEWDSIVGPISTRYSLDYYETTWGNLYSTYWLRRHFTLEKASDIRALDLMLNNDDDMEIYLNGKMLYQPKQLNRRTKLVEFSENVPSLLRDGDNVVAVRISDSAGGDAFVDFGMTGYAEPKKYFALHHSVDSLSTILAKDLSLANPTAVSEAKAFLEQTKSDMEAFVYDDADAEEQTVMIDWMISRVTNKYLAINVSVPGSMGDSVLAQADKFSDIQSLKLTGKLNEADVNNLTNRMTNLREIDLEGVDMPEIPAEMFQHHKLMQKIILPSNVLRIGQSAFYRCEGLLVIDFPVGIVFIDNSAFGYCKKLRTVELPEGLERMGYSVFYGCENLRSVKIPSTLKTIRESTFGENQKLATVDFSEGLVEIGSNAFRNCAIEQIKFPNTLRYIRTEAFRNNRKLHSIEFNEGLYQIEDNAFNYCEALTEIVLPSSLVLAHYSPFDYCNQLRKVTCLSIEPPYIVDQIPNGCEMEGRELYVPALSINSYKQCQGWDKFPAIKPIDYLPENFTVLGNLYLTLPENIPSDYKPNVNLIHDYKTSSYEFEYGHLTVNGIGTLSMNSFGMVWDPNYVYDSESRKCTYTSLINNSHLRSDSVNVEMYVHNDVWTFISFPFDVKVSTISAISPGVTNWIIHRYDGAKRANGEINDTWQKMKAEDILKAGEGYIIQSSRYNDDGWQSYSGFVFKAVNNEKKNLLFTTENVDRSLTEYASEFAHNRSWNLIGNPYPSYFDTRFMQFDAPITVWNPRRRTYTAYSPADDAYILYPGEAFFVQCPVENTHVVFTTDGRQKTSAVRELDSEQIQVKRNASAMRRVVNLTISNGTLFDRTRIVFNDEAGCHYEMDKDASKFMSPDFSVPQISTVENGTIYAINERPLGNGLINLNTRIGADGLYTIALVEPLENCKVILEDKVLAKSVVLSAHDSYSFFAKSTDTVNRFILHFVQDVTGIEGVSECNEGTPSIYTLEGVKVKEPLQKGIYIRDGKKVLFNK